VQYTVMNSAATEQNIRVRVLCGHQMVPVKVFLWKVFYFLSSYFPDRKNLALFGHYTTCADVFAFPLGCVTVQLEHTPSITSGRRTS
jgi:hypothetical protein